MLHNAVYIIDGERAVGFLALLIATPTQHPYLISGRTQVSLRETGTAARCVGVANSSRPSQFSLPPKFRLEEMMVPFRVTRRTITPQLSITFVQSLEIHREKAREMVWRDPIGDLRDLSSLFLFLRSDRWRTIGRERRGN